MRGLGDRWGTEDMAGSWGEVASTNHLPPSHEHHPSTQRNLWGRPEFTHLSPSQHRARRGIAPHLSRAKSRLQPRSGGPSCHPAPVPSCSG